MVRTRIACVSDTHGHSPRDGAFKLPKGDVLIHAGDLTDQGSMAELRRAVEWIENADFEVKIVIAGNHDITLDRQFYSQNSSAFHNQHLESPDDCINLMANSSIVYLNHESANIRLSNGCTFKIFGSPYSPAHGKWAFGYGPDEARHLWSDLPPDTDITVTHTPPLFHCDKKPKVGSLGCEYLREALWRVRPRLAVCGHVHEGRGYERVRWNLTGTNEDSRELDTKHGELPPYGSKKQCLIDLTGKTQPRLDNDGKVLGSNIEAKEQCPEYDFLPNRAACNTSSGRNETCVVNAAIMATSWPHKGGKKFNAPLIVDLDLPCLDDEDVG